MGNWKLLKQGKVRDIYGDNEDFNIVTPSGVKIYEHIIIHTTDRTSAFDRNIPTEIPGRGEILTKMTYLWAQMIDKAIIPLFDEAALIYHTSIAAMLSPRDLLMERLKMIPIECIVRGYLTGKALESYQKTGKVFGHEMPEGLVEGSKLPEPIFTPTTKAAPGEEDKPISLRDYRELIANNKDLPYHRYDIAEEICNQSISLYKEAYEFAYKRGIIIADTKFEFGFDIDGNLRLADEILTPDSSRFWSVADYKEGRPQASLDKQPLRDFLKAHPEYKDQPLPQEIIDETTARYQKVYDMLFGDFTP